MNFFNLKNYDFSRVTPIQNIHVVNYFLETKKNPFLPSLLSSSTFICFEAGMFGVSPSMNASHFSKTPSQALASQVFFDPLLCTPKSKDLLKLYLFGATWLDTHVPDNPHPPLPPLHPPPALCPQKRWGGQWKNRLETVCKWQPFWMQAGKGPDALSSHGGGLAQETTWQRP